MRLNTKKRTNASREPSAVLSSESVISLFKNCMEFTLNSRTFIHRTSELHRVGVNAQVMAAQSGKAEAVLSSLVREIGILTSSINNSLELISNSGELLAKNSISTTRTAHMLQMYYRAWQAGLKQDSNKILLDVYANLENDMHTRLQEVSDQLNEHMETLVELRSAVVFIPALINLININIAEFPEYTQHFKSTSTELDEFREFIEHSTKLMSKNIKASIKLITNAI